MPKMKINVSAANRFSILAKVCLLTSVLMLMACDLDSPNVEEEIENIELNTTILDENGGDLLNESDEEIFLNELEGRKSVDDLAENPDAGRDALRYADQVD